MIITTAMKHHNNALSIPVIQTLGDAKKQVHFTVFIPLAGTIELQVCT
jgi:hypothetical protein